MQAIATAVDALVKLAEQLNHEEKQELIRRIEALDNGETTQAQRLPNPIESLHVFHVDHFPETMTLRREDEYGDDGR